MSGLFPQQRVNSTHLAPLREWIRNLVLLNNTNRSDSLGQIPGFWVIPKKYIVIPKKYFFRRHLCNYMYSIPDSCYQFHHIMVLSWLFSLNMSFQSFLLCFTSHLFTEKSMHPPGGACLGRRPAKPVIADVAGTDTAMHHPHHWHS
jgi:hypothetical protein